jgi:signal transduction histidine kinase/AraC-like DNA-binding protein/ABC-type sugar transport system substrate-binding protein/ActR/RegA family two-component response regulator
MRTLLSGISAAARDWDCNLLLACGISTAVDTPNPTSAWPIIGSDVDFLPVGPQNTDGLIVVPQLLSAAQSDYVQKLLAEQFPLIFAGSDQLGPAVAIDNAGGIRQAFRHLLDHGHQRIAFIAGLPDRSEDSTERLRGYYDAMRDAGLPIDPRLVAYGMHHRSGGWQAMQQILSTGAPFTAVLASNDTSCLGAMEALQHAGLRIPEQIAIIGFDDRLDARASTPSLTTIRHPTFALGYQSVVAVLEQIAGRPAGTPQITISTQLIVRRSCGCHTGGVLMPTLADLAEPAIVVSWAGLVRAMAEATLVEARHSVLDEVEDWCRRLVEAFTASLGRRDIAPFAAELLALLRWVDARSEEAHAWHAAISILRHGLPALLEQPPAEGAREFVDALLDWARMGINERVRRQTTHALARHMAMADQLGLMTAQLLTTLNESQITAILAQHLPAIGIQHMLVGLYISQEDDPVGQSSVLLSIGLAGDLVGRRFTTREFPPPDFYPGDAPFQLALLPLIVDEALVGFCALDAANLEPDAAIMRNLAAALRNSRLYREALEGRRLAEEANQLKSRFLSMVSHELRTPLNLIRGLSDMLLRERDQSRISPDTLWQDIERISANAQHLGRLIEDLLDLASSESGQLRLLQEPIDLVDVLRAIATTCEHLVREKGLVWHMRVPAQGLWVLGDRTRLQQVVLNLISNAVKFTAQGAVSLEVSAAVGEVAVSVSDTGLGIPLDEQAWIFSEFRRSGRTVQRGYSGLGLGLTICKQLIERHGGVIGVHSTGEEGSGTTFFFKLPTIAQAPAQPYQVAPLLAANRQVLLLTEYADEGQRLGVYLRDHGFAVEVWRVGETPDWLPRLLAAPPGVLILDHQLAAHQGWTIMGTLKRHLATEHIPVLVYYLDLDRDRGRLLELNYLIKPLAHDQLAQALAHRGMLGETQAVARIILVVDDDPGTLEFHTRLVQQQVADCRVVQARTGREALATMEQLRPDLVLLDLMMPEMDGFGVLDAMRAQESTRDVPVIVLTGQVLTEADMVRLNRSVATILSKGSFTAQETLGHIQSALAHHRAMGRASQRLVRKVIAFIHAHYAEPLTRDQVADYVAVSPDHLTDCFHQEMGMTPLTYLNRFRITRARALLETSDWSVTKIALTVGFSSGSYFSRIFHREIGMSPRSYRRAGGRSDDAHGIDGAYEI